MKAFDRLSQRVENRFRRWLDRRIPATESIKLTHRQLFIFPSKAGFGFMVLITLFWLLATNYENNPIFALCFLLAALFVIAIHVTHGNLSGMSIRQVNAQSVFAGQNCAVTIALSQPNNKIRDSIILHFANAEPLVVSMHQSGDSFVSLLVPTHKRGLLPVQRLTIESYYPFGLLRVWSIIQLRFNAVVYPKPLEGTPQARVTTGSKNGHFSGEAGSDDYVGLKRYQQGDSLRHVAWKHYAREQGLWSKHFSDPTDQQQMIDWDAFSGMHREQRLSHMCWLVKEYSNAECSYGLKLPGLEVAPGFGVEHCNALLSYLALFEIDQKEAANAG